MLFEDDVLDHAAVTLRHQKHVAIRRRLLTHQAIVDHIGDLSTGERRRDMQRGDLLRNVEDAAPVPSAALARGVNIKAINQAGTSQHALFLHCLAGQRS